MRPPLAVHRILALLGGVGACVALATPAVAADRIYKYVDQDGLVTYSSTPPAREETVSPVEELLVPEAPKPEDVETARKRAQEDARLANQWLQERRKLDEDEANRRAAVAAAEQSRQQAALQAYMDPTIDGPYYLPYFPNGWVVPPNFQRPPFHHKPLFMKHGLKHAPASLRTDPFSMPVHRRR